MPRRKATPRRTKRLREYDDTYLRCRAIGHAWDEADAKVYSAGSSTALLLDLQCMRCPTKRFDEYTGSLLRRRRYKYPDGYAMKQSAPGERVPFRLEYVSRRRAEAPRRKAS